MVRGSPEVRPGIVSTWTGPVLRPSSRARSRAWLVAKGLLTRDTDPADRRRAVIARVPAVGETLDAFYDPARSGGFAILRRHTVAELDMISDFLDRGRALQMAAAERIRSSG